MKSFFKKRGARLGQHLLTSKDIAREVAEAVGVSEGDTVLEVGPGKGMLTRELLRVGARVIAVEKDSSMVEILEGEFASAIEVGTLTLVEGDARTVLAAHSSVLTAPYKVVANIPYYITGELIRLFLTAPVQPTAVSLLVQKEVAERIARSAKESLLSLSVKAYGTPRYVRTVYAGSFNPPPSVDSAILAIEHVSRTHFNDCREEFFFTLLHWGFGQKRKTLFGNLKRANVDATLLKEVFAELHLDATVRAEDVPLATWLALTNKLDGARAVQ